MAYKGSTPKLVVVVDGVAVFAKAASITLTNKSESSNATVVIPMETINSKVFTEKGVVHTVDIYAGYINELVETADTLKNLIEAKEYEQKLQPRFQGFLDQPEWEIGIDGNMLTLNCNDLAGLLMDGKFTEKKEGSAVNASAIIKQINSTLKGFEVVFDAKDFSMGTKDESSKKKVYNVSGKSYWDVIKDIAQQGNLNIVKGPKKITISDQPETTQIWTMYKNADNSAKENTTNFSKLHIRYGRKGGRSKDNILVEILTTAPVRPRKTASKKKTVIKTVIGRYPKNSKGWDGAQDTEVVRLRATMPMDQQTANAKAEAIAMEHLKGYVSGDVELPFANELLNIDHGISFVSIPDNFGLAFLAGFVYRIDSITETFDVDGYKQNIEFESDPKFKENQRDTRPAPKPKEVKQLGSLGYTVTRVPPKFGFNKGF